VGVVGHNGAVKGIRAVTPACAAGVVLVTSVLLSGCVQNVSGNAVRAHQAPSDVPQLTKKKLDDVLLSAGEVNAIMGSTTMTVTSDLDDMTNHSEDVSDPDCLGAIYGAETPVYKGSDWTAVRDQVLREPGEDNEHWVEQAAVLYPSADKASAFFDTSESTWKKCAGNAISVYDGNDSYLWQLDDVVTHGDIITQMTAQEDADGWACQHALSVVSNVTVEAWACGYSLANEATAIVTDMVSNAAKK
jgi:hypothetical protein